MNPIKRPLSFIQPSDTETKKLRSKQYLLHRPLSNCFENLSNELFYEIFDYLDGSDIYNAFSNLNIRFQNLISCSSIPIRIDLGLKSKSFDEYRCRHLILPNKHRILSLQLKSETLIDEFFKHCTIDSSFNRLESIVLSGLTDRKLLWILFYLNSLPRLYSLNICIEEEYYYNLGDIYRLIFSLPALNYNKLSFMSYEETEIIVPNVINENFSSVKYLIVDHSCTLDQLTSLLYHTPQLCHLTCERLVESDEHVKQDLQLTLFHLRCISIGECYIDFDDFEAFINEISSELQILNISVSWNMSYLDADRWQKLIEKNMPHLNKFHFNYTHYTQDDFGIYAGYAFIDKFASSFWRKRKWLSEVKIQRREMFFSIHPYKKEWFDSSEHMATDTYSNRLTIDGNTTTEQTRLFVNKMKSTCVTVQFTHLNINCNNLSVGMLTEIMRLLPNLHSLQISSLLNLELSSSSGEDIKNQLLISIMNKIAKVKLSKFTEKKQIQFLINICSRMRYLEVDCMSDTNLGMLLKFILTNQVTHTPNLCSVCFTIPNANENMIQNLAMVIDLETLINSYTIQRIGDKISLQWKLE